MDDMLENAALVVAHPDDEALWFSSILRKVKKVIICFLDLPGLTLGENRRRALEEFPLQTMTCLEIAEFFSFITADWRNPKVTDYGIEVTTLNEARKRYRATYDRLLHRLRDELSGFQNVYSHNPWGEYGNELHVQVYRVVDRLRGEYGFQHWVSNYASNRTIPFVNRYIRGYDWDYITFPTDIELAHELRDLYMKHGAWTWDETYRWFAEESFMRTKQIVKIPGRGHIFPLNYVFTDLPVHIPTWLRIYRSLSLRLRRLFRR